MDAFSGVIFFFLFVLNFSAADVKYPVILGNTNLSLPMYFQLLLVKLYFLLQYLVMEEVS